MSRITDLAKIDYYRHNSTPWEDAPREDRHLFLDEARNYVRSADEWDRENGVTRIAAAELKRTITTADELLALPEESVVIGKEGDVSQKRAGMWCSYETAPLNSNRLARLDAPLTVLWEPQS